MDNGNDAPKRRRRHSPEFKAQVIQACKQPDVSIAATALRYQLNANLVRIWIKTYDQKVADSLQIAHTSQVPEFIPLQLPPPPKVANSPDIIIEVKRGAANITVRWPSAAAAECAQWLRHWLR